MQPRPTARYAPLCAGGAGVRHPLVTRIFGRKRTCSAGQQISQRAGAAWPGLPLDLIGKPGALKDGGDEKVDRVPRILITSVGSLVGHNLLTALEPVRDRLFMIGVETDPGAVNNFRCDAAYMVPPTKDESGFTRRLREIVVTEGVSLVIAGTDSDLPALARLSAEESLSDTVFLVPPLNLVEICNDKYQTALFAREHGLPFAETAVMPEELDRMSAQYGYPLIAKARRGSATQAVFLIRDPAEARAALMDGGVVLQPYLGDLGEVSELLSLPHLGLPLSASFRAVQYSAQLLFGRDGSILGHIATEASMEGGRSVRCRRIHDDQLDALALLYGARMAQSGYRGPLNIQSKRLSDGRYVPFELNARFTGQTDARALLGYNEAYLAIEHFLDLEWELETETHARQPESVARILTSYTTDRQDVDALAKEGRWARSSRA